MKTYFRKSLFKLLTLVFDRKKLIFLLANEQEKTLLGFETGGYLQQTGWVNSIITKTIIDADNKPLPWVTYPFIAFMQSRLNNTLTLFEFGSGNSTYWYADKVKTVTSVEHDVEWYEKIKPHLPQNVDLRFCYLQYNGAYSQYLLNTQVRYDIIIVDGRDRVNCCKNSINALSQFGVLVLDDSDRDEYKEAHTYLQDAGFKQIDFWGMAPLVNYLKCTSIFYKNNNCLNI